MPTPTGAEPRLVAARALQRVLDQGRALDEALGIGLVDLQVQVHDVHAGSVELVQ